MACGRGRETEKTRDSEHEGEGDQREKSKTEKHTEYFQVFRLRSVAVAADAIAKTCSAVTLHFLFLVEAHSLQLQPVPESALCAFLSYFFLVDHPLLRVRCPSFSLSLSLSRSPSLSPTGSLLLSLTGSGLLFLTRCFSLSFSHSLFLTPSRSLFLTRSRS